MTNAALAGGPIPALGNLGPAAITSAGQDIPMPKIVLELTELEHSMYKGMLEFIARDISATSARNVTSHKHVLTQVQAAMTIQSMRVEPIARVPVRIGATFLVVHQEAILEECARLSGQTAIVTE